MEEQINKVKNFKQFLNENIENLPKSIDIDNELSILRKLEKEKEKIRIKKTGDISKDVFNQIHTKGYSDIFDKEIEIEDIIKNKLWDVMMKYCENGDYEGAKWFIGNSYKDMNTSGKVLLFRSILVHQQQNENKKG
jgi:hypothetical protein